MQQPALSAFFSYSRADSEFAQRLARSLRAAGANIWLDQLDIEPGKRWDRAVEDALASCPSLLVILTPSSVDSTNVMDEVSFALEEGKTVIPVLYRDCKIPFRLRRVQYVDFRADYDEGVRQLLTVLPEHGVPTQIRESTTQSEHEIEQAHAGTLPPQRSATPEVPAGPGGRGHSAAPLPLAPAAMSVTRGPGISAPGTPRRHSTSRLLVTGAVGLLVLLAIVTFVALTFKRQGQRDSSAEKRSEVEPRTSVDQPAGTKAVPPTASDDSRRLAGSAISPEKPLTEASKTAANQPAPAVTSPGAATSHTPGSPLASGPQKGIPRPVVQSKTGTAFPPDTPHGNAVKETPTAPTKLPADGPRPKEATGAPDAMPTASAAETRPVAGPPLSSPPPEAEFISPRVLNPGRQQVKVDGFYFDANTKATFNGGGIEVLNVRFIDQNHLILDVDVTKVDDQTTFHILTVTNRFGTSHDTMCPLLAEPDFSVANGTVLQLSFPPKSISVSCPSLQTIDAIEININKYYDYLSDTAQLEVPEIAQGLKAEILGLSHGLLTSHHLKVRVRLHSKTDQCVSGQALVRLLIKVKKHD